MNLVSVAAVADNLAIGKDGENPWESLPEDKAQYRERVSGDPVILGRRTFESMLDDLPGRAQIVMSRIEREYDVETAHHAGSVEEALELAEALGDETVYVLGGGDIYDLFLPFLDRMVLSRIPGTYEGDTYYPEWDPDEWKLVGETRFENFTVEEWERIEDTAKN